MRPARTPARRVLKPAGCAEKVSIDLDREHLPVGARRARQRNDEQPRPGAQIGNVVPGAHLHRGDDLRYFEPRDPLGVSSVAIQSSAGRDARCAPAASASTAARTNTIAALFMHDDLTHLFRFVKQRRWRTSHFRLAGAPKSPARAYQPGLRSVPRRLGISAGGSPVVEGAERPVAVSKRRCSKTGRRPRINRRGGSKTYRGLGP